METYKIVMLIILLALEIPAVILLAVWWVQACKEAKNEREKERKED